MRKSFKKFVVIATTCCFMSAAVSSAYYWDSTIWTTWDIKPTLVQSLYALAKLRDKLNKTNLHDAYTKARKQVDCSSAEARMYRQNDGTCNDLSNTVMGAVNTRISRNVTDLSKLDSEINEKALSFPNPLVVSREILARPDTKFNDDSYTPVPSLNVIAAAWIQFQTHDWFSHGDNMNDTQITHPWVIKDPGAKAGDLSELILPRTQIDRTRDIDDAGYPTYNNTVTHWWDGSQIYGSSFYEIDCKKNLTENNLRECAGGKLKMRPGDSGLLPIDAKTKKERTGFNQNWWVGLSFLHTLFARNHNTVALELAKNYPTWNDEKLFHTARLINAAIIAKIHTVEWTPGILDNTALRIAMNSNWYGLEKYLQRANANDKDTIGTIQRGCKGLGRLTDFNFTNEICTIFGGIVGGKKELHHVPFSMSEEFVAVYRLHSLLPENLVLSSTTEKTKIGIVEAREDKTPGVVDRFGMSNIAKSLGVQNAGALTLQNFPRFLRNVNIEIPGLSHFATLQFDMAAVDLVRDRERGLPRYNEFRRQLQLKPIRDFTDLMPQTAIPEMKVTAEMATKNRALTAKLKEVYQDVENIDLLVGSLAESYRPRGYGFGETLFQVFITMASRRLQADRFYTTDFNAKTYSEVGMRLVDEATMKSIILKNFKDIPADIIPTNAFNPWKTTEVRSL